MFKDLCYLFFLSLLVVLPGCRIGPSYYQPNFNLPDKWKMEGEANCQEENNLAAWWETFQDPFLNALIERSLGNNPDIGIAVQKILEERAEYNASKAGLYPNIYFGSGYANLFEPKDGVFLGQQSLVNFLNSQNVFIKRHLQFFHMGPSVFWEIDIFGRIRSAMAAYGAEWEASFEHLRGVQISLSAEIVRNYIDLREFESQLAIEMEYLDKLEMRQTIFERRLQLGFSSLDDIATVAQDISEAKILILQLERSIEEAKQRLATLAGYTDASELCLHTPISPFVPYPTSKPYVGIPADLLCQRPDIVEAERELAAAVYRIGSVMAQGLPNFVIIGSLGGISEQLKQILQFKNFYSFYDLFLSAPIYDGGRNKYNLLATRAQADAAFAKYHKTLLIALEEVQIALFALNFEKERLYEKRYEVSNNEKDYQRHVLLYEKRNADFRAFSEAEDSYYLRKRELVQFEAAVSLNFVTLSKALGGYSEKFTCEL